MQWQIYGNGSIGDKAEQILTKSEELEKIGFYLPETTILTEDIIDYYLRSNNLGTLRFPEQDDIESKIKNGTLNGELKQIFADMSTKYGYIPLAVRSSAGGDSRGTGIYSTKFCMNDDKELERALKIVIGSYFSESAIQFRNNTNTEGLGIIVQPLIGQSISKSFAEYAPIISGYGYTSRSNDSAYIRTVPFLGGGVNRRDALLIDENNAKQFSEKMNSFIKNNVSEAFQLGSKRYHVRSHVFEIDFLEPKYNAIRKKIESIDISQLFNMASLMEERFGKPQYFEWAMTNEKGDQKYWITQIADVDNISDEADMFNFGNLKNVIFKAKEVIGKGIYNPDKIVTCYKFSDLPKLEEFNRENKDYILLFSSALNNEFSTLEFKHFSNALAVIEVDKYKHYRGDSIGHFNGLLDTTKIIFGVLDGKTLAETWDCHINDNDYKFRIYEGPFEIFASEAQKELAVCLNK